MKQELCAALGDFDGVHVGHIAVINAAVKNCGDYTPAVYTFMQNCKNAKTITNNTVKEKLILSLGIKKVIFDDFDVIKDYTPLQFVKSVLIDNYNIKTIVCGKDFRFGINASGNIDTLNSICKKFGLKLITVDPIDENGKKISSSTIRTAIQDGDMVTAKSLLGRYFEMCGIVLQGKGLGHTKNTPTVNLSFDPNSIIPAFGVYITRTVIDNKKYHSITNVGIRPSVENTLTPNVETNIFDFDCDIYGKSITIEFIKMIRPEIKFESVDKLFEQISDDITQAKLYFSEENGEKNQ